MSLRRWLARAALALAALRPAAAAPPPAPGYPFAAEVDAALDALAAAHPGLARRHSLGQSVEGRPLWALTVADPTRPVGRRMVVIANIHAMEWIGTNIALAFLDALVAHPPPGVAVTVVPILNPDGRARVEADLRAGTPRFQRTNANRVDLNRDFAVHRDPHPVWSRVLPGLRSISPAPLSQPESRALDALLQSTRPQVFVSLHAWGGYAFLPWAGDWARSPQHAALVRAGTLFAQGQGARAYRVVQLSRWAFFFRGHGMEVDHAHAAGALALLVESTRGRSPLRPADWDNPFRVYNPPDPARATRRDRDGLLALARQLAAEQQGLAPPLATPPPARQNDPMPTDATLEPLRTRLRRANLRATAPRIAVLRAMDAAGRPLSHAELFQLLGGEAVWDRATIYRNLSDLTEVGLLRRYDLGDHTWRFEPAAAHARPADDAGAGHAHAHFTCVDCGAVSCVDDVTLRVPDGAAVPRALAASAVEIQLRGQCDDCATP